MNALLILVAGVGIAAALFWPRREDGLARAPRALIAVAIALLLLLALPTQEVERQAVRATEDNIAALTSQAAVAASSAASLAQQLKLQQSDEDALKRELALERDRSSKLERELAELKAKSGEEAQKRAREAADLEARLRKALELYADIERRAGGEAVTWSEAALFEEGRSALDCSSREKLSRLIPYLSFKLARNPELSILVEGHTDNVGTVDYNKKLSEDRASAVADYLIHAGINADKVGRVGLWFQRPAGSVGIEDAATIAEKNVSAALRKKNRRVEVIHLDKAPR